MHDESKIHCMVQSKDVKERQKAVNMVKESFVFFKDKTQAWKDLLSMTKDKDSSMRRQAAYALGSAFPHVTDKAQATKDLLSMTKDKTGYVRKCAVSALGLAFPYVTDKDQVTKVLLSMTKDKNISVRKRAAFAYGSAFPYVTDKDQAWNDLLSMIKDGDSSRRDGAASALDSAFPHVKDKAQAWNDLLSMIKDENKSVWKRAANALGLTFPYVIDKAQATKDLLSMTKDKTEYVRERAVYALGLAFPYITDKAQVWNDLLSMTKDNNISVRNSAEYALNLAFPHVMDKAQAKIDLMSMAVSQGIYNNAWADIIQSIRDVDEKIQREDAEDTFESDLFNNYVQMQEWKAIHHNTYNTNIGVRKEALDVIISNFPGIPDKNKAWSDMIRLTKDTDKNMRISVSHSLEFVFPYVPDKEKAWLDLHRLTQNDESYLRRGAAYALGSAFYHVSNKEQAWSDLQILAQDDYNDVRRGAAYTLGSIFSHIPDKERAFEILHQLTRDDFSDVRAYANHSLGRAFIFKATESLESKEFFKKKLETAIEFFIKASNETTYSNPANFCLPFYRSFYAITFQKHDSEAEINKYLAEAKSAVEGSESKEKLLEAVENLANALNEVHKAQETGFEDRKSDLNSYRRYCERASYLLVTTGEKAPAATKLLIRGFPIIDEEIKSIIPKIQNKAKELCKNTKNSGTPFENMGAEVNQLAKQLSEKDNLKSEKTVNRIKHIIGESCIHLPQDKRGHASDIINEINEDEELVDNLSKIELLLTYLLPITPKHAINDVIYDRNMPSIGIVTALPEEYAAIEILLENRKSDLIPGQGAGRRYCLGEIPSTNGGKHNIVLLLADMGNNIAAVRASILLVHFSSVKSIIMVGIAGGVPYPEKPNEHVRLGDIVVSDKKGVIQYEFIKNQIKENEYRHPPRPPSASLLEAVKYLKVEEIKGSYPWLKFIEQGLNLLKSVRPEEKTDILVRSKNIRKIIPHPPDPKRIKGQPRLFLGPIASSHTLLKNPLKRDELRDKFGVKAIEMEGSGIADATWNHEIGYLVVRGICDYCDANKKDDWQMYSAIVAASYTRALIESIPTL